MKTEKIAKSPPHPPAQWKNLWQFQSDVPRKYLSGQLSWFLLWVFTVAVALVMRPSHAGHGTHQQLGLPPCASVLFFGRPCPGCGMTTSWTATIHGQLGLAFHAHPLGPIMFLGFTISALTCGWGFLKNQRWRTEVREHTLILLAVLIIFVSFGAWRFYSERAFYTPEASIWTNSTKNAAKN
jgi:hypothetical protein